MMQSKKATSSTYRFTFAGLWRQVVLAIGVAVFAYVVFPSTEKSAQFSNRAERGTQLEENVENQLTSSTNYSISSGVWRQRTVEGQHGIRTLSIDRDGHGVMKIELDGMPEFVIGSSVVTIETTWTLEGDQATFVLESGEPETSFDRILLLSLDQVTVFTVEGCTEDELKLVRNSDQKLFRWDRID